jgi:hypothetical protein
MVHPFENSLLPEESVEFLLQAYLDMQKPLLSESELEKKFKEMQERLGLPLEGKNPE